VWIQRWPLELRQLDINVRMKLLNWYEPSEGVAFQSLKRDGIEVNAARFKDTQSNIRWLLSQIQQSPPDVFLPNLVIPALFAARWVREGGIPTVGILHSDDDFYRGLQSEFLFGRQQFRLSALVCVSEVLKQQVLAGHPQDTVVRRIAYGVPVPATQVQRQTSVLRLAYVGRFAEEQKRISEVARAFCRCVREVPGTEAVLYGDGPDRTSVENVLAVEGKGLPVRLAGRVDSDQIQQQLLECHVIVLLSDYEGLPIALMEGMACGCVPVCLRIRSGIPELVEDGVTGLLVNDKADSFVKAIRRLRNEPDLWERLSCAARAKVRSQYSNECCAGQWAGLLRELHAASGSKCAIKIPGRFDLPPVHAALAPEDPRAPLPSPLPVRVFRRSRILAGKVRRWLPGQTVL